jgi:hypothetical protein
MRDHALEEAHRAQQRGDEEAARNYSDEAAGWDDDIQRLSAEHNQLAPPQIPKAWNHWIKKHAGFVEREGQVGVEAVEAALAYMARPRTDSKDPRYTGLGMTPQQIFTPQGLKQLDTILHTGGEPVFGVRFDSGEQILTPAEAARISGLSGEAYNRASKAVYQAGKFEFQKKGSQHWLVYARNPKILQ